MKNIKTYIIGFLSATCLFLFMGQSNNKILKVLTNYDGIVLTAMFHLRV